MARSTAEPEQQLAEARPQQTYVNFRMKRRTARNLLIVLVLILVFLGAARIFHLWNWGLSQEEIQQREAAAMVAKVGKLMLLPSGETPVIASVTDADSLKSQQPFYQSAQNGDVLLVYSQAERAILYRPSTNMIINVGPVYLDQGQGSQPAAGISTTNATSSAQ